MIYPNPMPSEVKVPSLCHWLLPLLYLSSTFRTRRTPEPLCHTTLSTTTLPFEKTARLSNLIELPFVTTPPKHKDIRPSIRTVETTLYLLLAPLKIIAPTPAAAMATPLSIATPKRPSLATFSSIRPLKLPACKFDGSWSSSRSLYLRASA